VIAFSVLCQVTHWLLTNHEQFLKIEIQIE